MALGCMLALLLVGAPEAQAKEGIERLRVCGASGCRTTSDVRRLQALIAVTHARGSPARGPLPGPFFTLVPVATRGWPTAWPRLTFVPSTKVVRMHWRRSDRGDEFRLTWALPHYLAATRGLRPFPRPR